MYSIKLPEDKKAREEAIINMVSLGKTARNPKLAKWWLSYYYLQGIRKFTNIDYSNGTIEFDVYNEIGSDGTYADIEHKVELIVNKLQSQAGRLMALDLAPFVEPASIGLEGMKDSKIANVVLSSLFPKNKSDRLNTELATKLLIYGTVGLFPYVLDDNTTAGIEVVPPWEILPIPSTAQSGSSCRGMIRRRIVPIDWLRSKESFKRVKKDVFASMVKNDVPKGEVSSGISYIGVESESSIFSSDTTGLPSSHAAAAKSLNETVVEFVEVWIFDDTDHLLSYTQMAGEKELLHETFKDEKLYPPCSVCRYIDTGSFWGRGFVELLIPMNENVELMSNTLFRNIMDLDLYGLLCMPTTLGIPNNIEKSSDGIRRVPYEPDNVTNAKPFAIQPANTGTLPASVMANAKDYLDELANQPSGLLRGEAPGRVDSSAGLGMLMETSNTSIMPSAQNEADAVSHCYKYMLGHIRKTWNDQDLVSVAMLDDSIAGIGIDISTGKMELSSNAIPHPDKVKIGIASSSPTSKQQDVMSLSEQLSAGIITPMEYRITIREKNLPVEVCNEQEWQNYRRAVLENIQQYGDGLVPNKIIVTDIDLHEVHLMVLDRFMAKPEFLLASKEVRAAFKAHRDRHLAGLGIMPEGAEFLEDAAQEFIDYNQYNEQNVATQPDMQNQGQDGAMMGDDINNYEQEQDMY